MRQFLHDTFLSVQAVLAWVGITLTAVTLNQWVAFATLCWIILQAILRVREHRRIMRDIGKVSHAYRSKPKPPEHPE